MHLELDAWMTVYDEMKGYAKGFGLVYKIPTLYSTANGVNSWNDMCSLLIIAWTDISSYCTTNETRETISTNRNHLDVVVVDQNR